jgi:HD-GYP domain-containing protein (c-di-GMP phosphodiesterase class II)
MAYDEINVSYLIEIDSKLNQIQDLDILLERVLFEARNVVHADAGSIYVKEMVEEEGQKVERLAIKYSQNDTTQKQLPPGQKLIYSFFTVPINDKTISGYCALTQQLVNVPDAYNLPEGVPYSFGKHFDLISGYKTTSMLAVPLKSAEGKLLGVIQVINSKDKDGNTVPFSTNDEGIISHFAANATLALEKAQIMRTMILRMIKMAELRDPKETGTHVNRVAGYTAELYERWANRRPWLTAGDREKDNIKIASMLHDVGKVAISDTILKKPARFTPEEYAVMQTHTVTGSAIFNNPQSPLDEMSRDIALTHHENWDGTGYPGWVDPVSGTPVKTGEDGKVLGKKGEEIPIEGQIVSLADVFDALCSKRAYKEPWTEENVLEEIRRLSGTKFNPELVDIFFEILPNIKNVQNRYPEAET